MGIPWEAGEQHWQNNPEMRELMEQQAKNIPPMDLQQEDSGPKDETYFCNDCHVHSHAFLPEVR